MDSNIVSYGLQYTCYLLEAVLVIYLFWTRQWKRQGSVASYLTLLLTAEVTRAYVLREYGFASRRYYYVYWSTDFLLVIGAFLLVGLFFRRACLREEKMWRLIRLLIVFVFVVVACISGLTLAHNRKGFFTYFIFDFNQNLYFTCLVLNTLLYLLLQHIESADEQLGLLVCGVGIQFAGPPATMALLHLTADEGFAKSLAYFTMPLCTLGMLLVWAYALARVESRAIKLAQNEGLGLATVAVHMNTG